jgi:hypothetical protein
MAANPDGEDALQVRRFSEDEECNPAWVLIA